MSDEDRSPLTADEQREVDRHMTRDPSADRAQLEDAMRRRRQHAAQKAMSERAAAELLANNAATLARSDLTPDERREAKMAAADGKSAQRAVNMARQIAHMTNGTAADDAGDSQVGDRQRERLRAEAEAPKVNAVRPKRTREPKPPEAPEVDVVALSAKLGDALPWGDEAAALLTRIVYAKHHDGAECPLQRIMTNRDAHGWWTGRPPGERRRLGPEVTEILRELAQRSSVEPLTAEQRRIAEAMEETGLSLADFLERVAADRNAPDEATRTVAADLQAMTAATIMTAPEGGRKAATIADAVEALPEHLELPPALLHELWSGCPDRGRHPLAPIVADWLEHAPRPVEVDRWPHAILPHSLRDARRDPHRLPLALDRDTPLGPVHSPGYLPGLAPPPSVIPPVPWLALYDLTASGPIQTRGRGAPLVQRLFVEILTGVPRDAREWTVAPPVILRELFEWSWPRYYDHEVDRMRGGYDWSRHLEPLRRALVELDNLRIEYDRMERRLIRVDDLPTRATPLDAPIRFHVRHLPGSDHGPMFERESARRWGVVSAAAWRAIMRLAYLWDEVKRKNHGARVFATRPRVWRVRAGGLLGPDGKPLTDKGKAVTNWNDPRSVLLTPKGEPALIAGPEGARIADPDAVPTYERNPAADRVPVLGPDDLIRLTYSDDMDTNRRKRLYNARKALAAMEAAGEIVREPDGHGGERIIEARRLPPLRGDADPATC